PQGEADQDRCQGGEPRPLCYLPDGRGRHRTANVRRDFAAHRGATAAATTSARVRRSMSCIQEQPTEGVRPNVRENGQIRPRPSVRATRGVVAVSTSRLSCKRAGKTRTLMPVWDSSGESRLRYIGTGPEAARWRSKSSSAIAGLTARDMRAVLWTG